jgi:hypothetical protein
MENEMPEAMSAFVSWIYTGRISTTCKVAPEALWILGDRLRSPSFANEAMHLIFTRYLGECLKADAAEYVYEHTSEGSKLRQFIRDLVLAEGPLESCGHPNCDQDAKLKEEWRKLIRRKCDLVHSKEVLSAMWMEIRSHTIRKATTFI